MFLGFRHQDGDFLYGTEWSTFNGWMSIHVAFSRDHADKKAGQRNAMLEVSLVLVCVSLLLKVEVSSLNFRMQHCSKLILEPWTQYKCTRPAKVYVQDLIEEQWRHVCKLLDAWPRKSPDCTETKEEPNQTC